MRRATLCLLLVALGLVLTGPRASAHAQLRSSNPEDGARVSKAPERITLTFTEPPELTLSTVRVLDTSGNSFESGDAQVDPADDHRLIVGVDGLDRGVYTVTWRTVSKTDGHTTAGSFAFGVGEDPSGAPPPPDIEEEGTRVSPLEVFGRSLFLIGLVALVGAAVLGAAVVRSSPREIRFVAWIGVAAALLGAVLQFEGQRRSAASSITDFLATGVGRAAFWRLAGPLAAGVGLFLSRNRRVARESLWFAVAGGLVAMAAHIEAGHAGAEEQSRWLEIGVQLLHFAAVAIWIGGLAALLAALSELGDRRRFVVRRFSTLAGITLAVVAVTGVVRAITALDSWSELVDSSYGRLVLVKIALLLGLTSLGAVNRYRNVRRADPNVSGLRRVSRIELGVAVVTLSIAALLASTSPPSDVAEAAAPSGITATGSDFGTTVKATLTVTPGVAGINTFGLRLGDYDTDEPISARRVSLRFSFRDDPGIEETQLALKPAGPGRYEAEGANLSLAGRWEVTAVVEQAADSQEIPLELATQCGAQEVPEPGRPSVWVIDIGGGLEMQSYVDPGAPGANTVHVTFFSGAGKEVRAPSAPTIDASSGSEELELDVTRLSRGHFAGAGELTEGEWRFAVAGRTLEGDPASGCFEETIAS
jgi:copper transport protein